MGLECENVFNKIDDYCISTHENELCFRAIFLLQLLKRGSGFFIRGNDFSGICGTGESDATKRAHENNCRGVARPR